MRERILFFAESVTMAQVTRLYTLARALQRDRYEVHFASAEFHPLVFGSEDSDGFVRHPVRSVDPDSAANALRAGRRIYDTKTLRQYIRDDLRLFDAVEPALVVGDFRLSLTTSAPLAGVPHAALVNAYWDPARLARYLPVPDHPVVRLLGEALTARYFPQAAPRAFAHFAAPVNVERRRAKLPSIGGLPEVLTHGDHVLYPDPPELVPVDSLRSGHEYLGYVPWSPPDDGGSLHVEGVGDTAPFVYVTMGSSGRTDVLPAVIEGLSPLDVTVLVATAGRAVPSSLPPNVRTVPFVPGDRAARRAALVVSNGGSSTGYQALAEGTPVLGIPSNLDQYLAMTAIADSGAGVLLPARTLSAGQVRKAARAVIESARYRQNAGRIAKGIQAVSYAEQFRSFVDRVTRKAKGAVSLPGALGRLAAFAIVAGAALTVSSARAEPALPAPVTNEVRFSVSVDGSTGHVVCALFKRSGWLEKPVKWGRVVIRKEHSECVFSGISPDVYAISAFHDENDNTKLDTNFLGIPTESWCTSRGAKAIFGPPSFNDAKFLYRGSIMRLQGTMK